ncbi:MAG: esterase family protein [Psychrosphaera sp.]|nr:esterase family protein [Psychrosphaera sp.]
MTRTALFTKILTLSLLLISYTSFGQTVDGFNVSKTIESKHLKESRQIKIKLPKSYDQSKQRYPVLYLLDGQNLQSNTAFIYDFLSGKRHIPEMIIVSIPHTGQRTRDYNTFFRDTAKVNPGADHFLDFLANEVIPLVDTSYRSTDYRLLAGHSQAGLLVFHSLIKKPELFIARFAFRPSMHLIPEQRKLLKQLFKANKDTTNLNSYFYTNVGGSEFFKMTKAFAATQQIFKDHAPAGLRFDFDFHEVDGHQSSPFIGQHLAFKRLYAPLKLGHDFEKMTVEQVINHFNNVSDEFGDTIKPTERELSSQESYYVSHLPDLVALQTLYKIMAHYYPDSTSLLSNKTFLEQWFKHGADKAFTASNTQKPTADLLNIMGYDFVDKDNRKALYLLKLATKLHPDLSNPFDSYGEVLEHVGDHKNAAKMYQQAYAIGTNKSEDADTIAIYQRNLKRAEAMVKQLRL